MVSIINLIAENNKQNEGLTVTFHSTQHICIKNILPMSDELGMKLDNKSVEYGGYGFVKFSIKNNFIISHKILF